MGHPTQETLDQIYPLVAKELARIFILEDVVSLPLEPKLREIADELTWRPVAQYCVVEMLRPILIAAYEGHNIFTKIWRKVQRFVSTLLMNRTVTNHVSLTEKLLTETWRRVITANQIARESGLQRIVDAELAMAITAKVVYDSDVFKTPKTLETDGKQVIVEFSK